MKETREKLTEWIAGTDTCFLIGAGCSICANKPSIDNLTKMVLEKSEDDELKQQFNKIQCDSTRHSTIEDLMNYLILYKNILQITNPRSKNQDQIQKYNDWLNQIKGMITDIINDNWVPSTTHMKLLQWRYSHNKNKPCDIFSLNYDTIIEASLDKLRIPYVDGFRGGSMAWFDSEVYNLYQNSVSFRIYKLHGSINWKRDMHGLIRCDRMGSLIIGEEPVVLYPSEQKFYQSQYGVYETQIMSFRNRLREKRMNNLLVVLGYSFNDNHINEAIFDSITEKDNNLTIIAFVGPENSKDDQVKRFRDFKERSDSRFNAFIGDGNESGEFIGSAVDEEIANDILNHEFWKFENLVHFIAGVQNE